MRSGERRYDVGEETQEGIVLYFLVEGREEERGGRTLGRRKQVEGFLLFRHSTQCLMKL